MLLPAAVDESGIVYQVLVEVTMDIDYPSIQAVWMDWDVRDHYLMITSTILEASMVRYDVLTLEQ